jgi:hypothetical protein
MIFDNMNTNYEKGTEWVSPSYSNEVFERAGVEKVFFLVLLLVIIGEFFASPATALADSAVINALGDKQVKQEGGSFKSCHLLSYFPPLSSPGLSPRTSTARCVCSAASGGASACSSWESCSTTPHSFPPPSETNAFLYDSV